MNDPRDLTGSALPDPSFLFEVRKVKKTFFLAKGRKNIEVLKGIDLTIRLGEMLAIEGASGAGKSTLLHLLGGLDRPTEGKILFRGNDLFEHNEETLAAIRNHHMGFVFQFHHLLPEFSALENTMMPALIRGMKKSAAEIEAERILTQLGLKNRLTHKPGELSGGEQQRVAVARALLLNPRVILADEPTGNLDTRTGEEVQNLLLQINRENGIALMVVTHNTALAEKMGRRVLLVDGLLHENH
jgi:lipoprotein-releasing system ATP-binding protein